VVDLITETIKIQGGNEDGLGKEGPPSVRSFDDRTQHRENMHKEGNDYPSGMRCRNRMDGGDKSGQGFLFS